MIILYFVLFHLLLLVPAFGFLNRYKVYGKNPLLQLSLTYVLSILFLGLGGLAVYALDLPKKLVMICMYLAIFGGIFLFVTTRSWKQLIKSRFVLIILVLMSLLPTLVISLSVDQSNQKFFPDPSYNSSNNYSTLNVKVLNFAQTQANDNYIPYRQAQFFSNNSDPGKDSFINEWGVSFFQRTILMGSATSAMYTLLNDNPPIAYIWSPVGQDPDHTYVKFQVFSHILNSLLVIPAALLISKFFDRKTANLSVIFIAISHFYLYNSIFSWPKSLATFFVLISFYLLLEGKIRGTVLAGLISGVAYMAHDLGIIFIATSIVLLIIKRRFYEIALYMAASLPFLAIWSFVSSHIYNKASTFIYYPFAIHGLPQDSNKATIIRDFFNTSPFEILKLKLKVLYRLLLPYQLIDSEGGKPIAERLWGVGVYSIPGSLGLGLLAAGVASVPAHFKKVQWEFWFITGFPILVVLGVYGAPDSIGSLHFSEGIVALLTGVIVFSTLKIKRYGKTLILAALAGNIAYLLGFVAYSYNYNVGRWLTNLKDIVLLALVFLIILLLLVSAHGQLFNKKWAYVSQK